MSKVGQVERITQERVIALFRTKLKYEYLGDWTDRPNNRCIEESYLTAFLQKQGYSATLIKKTITQLKKVAENQVLNLYDLNKSVYTLLRYGINEKDDNHPTKQTVWLIDWQNPLNNHFAFAEEVSVQGENRKRPDIVLYINGIALGVLELKRSTVSVAEGIRQNLDNQKAMFIKPFFATIQIVMAGNDTEGLRYATTETPEKYFLEWKEENTTIQLPKNTPILDKHLAQVCEKTRFLELVHDFITFDRGIKKVCRSHQYLGIKLAQTFLKRREGGIIWHTQGSGKSLTMTWLAAWIKENIHNARVLLITDRDELDQQIEKVFLGVNEKVYRSRSGKDLIDKLNRTEEWLICSLVHKFGRRGVERNDEDYEQYIIDLKKSLPNGFQPKGDIYVFVDECHRTQSGQLHKAMKAILPNSVFIGFTGTPLLKKDKQTSLEVFGKYIHTYKFNEAVQDKVVLDLRYEARNIEQFITSQGKIDTWFDAKTKGLADIAKAKLKERWGTMQKVLSSKDRLNEIVKDIVFDMETKDELQSGKGNAMLVAGSIYQACKFYELFEKTTLKGKCAIITSYIPTAQSIKLESSDTQTETEKLSQYNIYIEMLGGKNVEDFEIEVKRKFIDEPAQMKLLIVVDKLLTGFDAPPATYLYIDKKMQDHALFQAICRVNRLNGEEKQYGYIVDYKDLFKNLEKSIFTYTNEAFANYDQSDIDGLLSDRITKSKERLENALEAVKALFEPVKPPKNSLDYQNYFCGNPAIPTDLKDKEPLRQALYKYVTELVRAYANLANEMDKAGYTDKQAEKIKNEVAFFDKVREEIQKASGEYLELKKYEADMRLLIDMYIGAKESQKINEFTDFTLLDLVLQQGELALNTLPENIRKNKTAIAETLENNVRKAIIEEMPTNPKYFERMSILLDELVQLRQNEAKSYEEYLKTVIILAKQVKQPNLQTYPASLDTSGKRALYDNLNKDERLALDLHETIMNTKKESWRGHKMKEKEIVLAMKKYITEAEAYKILEIIREQKEY
ncbi:MAG: HsdR family type I site-specific deoxyribonuclease [Microscillaceae bacterium]|jgi:type I restriction enzyme R subunit|nr:HsdR family type I site-specific deoxyribonuclease [Microscillaceae bacterium]